MGTPEQLRNLNRYEFLGKVKESLCLSASGGKNPFIVIFTVTGIWAASPTVAQTALLPASKSREHIRQETIWRAGEETSDGN